MQSKLAAQRKWISKFYWRPFYTEAGPINTIKGLVTGWKHMVTDPAGLHRLNNLYDDDEFIAELKKESVNVLFVAWSVGFSIEAEAIQRDMVISLTKRLHAFGIKVVPYICSVTMFGDELFATCPEADQWRRLDAEGNVILYHGKKHRPMACLRRGGWRRYQKRRIQMAIKAGLDCVYFDNPTVMTCSCYCDLCRRQFKAYLKRAGMKPFRPPVEHEVRKALSRQGKVCDCQLASMNEIVNGGPHARLARKWLVWLKFGHKCALDFLSEMSSYVHRLNPKTPITCNGGEWPAVNKDMDFILSESAWFPNLESGRYRSNLDLMHYYAGEAGYEKPVVALQGQDRTSRRDDPRIQRLSLAEGAAFSVSPCAHQYFEFHAPDFTRFFQKHERLFLDKMSVAPLGVIMPHIPKNHLPDVLAEQNILYDRILPEYLFDTDLSRYQAIIVDDIPQMAEDELELIIGYARSGGHVIATGASGLLDENWQKRKKNPFRAAASDRLRYREGLLLRPQHYFLHFLDWTDAKTLPKPKTLPRSAVSLLERWGALFQIKARPKRGIIINVTHSRQRTDHIVIHCLNYGRYSVKNLALELPLAVEISSAMVHSPGRKSRRIRIKSEGHSLKVILPEVNIYGIVEINQG